MPEYLLGLYLLSLQRHGTKTRQKVIVGLFSHKMKLVPQSTYQLTVQRSEGLAMTQFQQALKTLIEDQNYRQAVIEDPSRLTDDFNGLKPQDLLLLMQAWNATGDPRAAGAKLSLCHCCVSGTPT